MEDRLTDETTAPASAGAFIAVGLHVGMQRPEQDRSQGAAATMRGHRVPIRAIGAKRRRSEVVE